MNDDKPVGGGVDIKIDEEEEDFSHFSLERLLVHNNWKGRKIAYQSVIDKPQRNKVDFLINIKKICNENISSNIEILIDIFVAIIPYCTNEEVDLLCSAPLSLAVEKGLTGRPKVVSAAENFIILLAEQKKDVFSCILPSLSHRLIKSKIAALHMTAVLISEFGIKSFPMEQILKSLAPAFGDASPQVRKEATFLCCSLYKFMGQSLKQHLAGVRDAQLQDLEKQFAEIKGVNEPQRKIKGVEATQANCSVVFSEKDLTNECDDEQFQELDEEPVLAKLPKNFFVQALDKSISWQDRCSLVNDRLIPLLSRPRLKRDNYHELGSFIRAYLVDPQAPIMLLGFKMIQECARGLRAEFSPHGRSYLNPLFEKMKDKKTSVQEHVLLTLEKLVLYHCVTLDQCVDEIEKAMLSKNPSQRLNSISFCIRIIDKIESQDIGKLSTSYSVLKRMVNDEKLENREAGYALVAKLVLVFGEETFEPVFGCMDENHKSRFYTVLSQYREEKPRSESVFNSPAKKISRVELMSSSTLSGNPPQESSSKDCFPMNSGYNSKSLKNLANPDDGISLEGTMPKKDTVTTTMLGLSNGDTSILDLLRSKDWNRRLEGIEKIRRTCDSWTPSECTKYFDTLVMYLRFFPGFKESIFQVFSAMKNLIKDVQSRAALVSLGAAYVLVTEYTPRLTEAKNKAAVRELCSVFADRFGPRFVFKHMIAVAIHIHTPKLLQEVNEYLCELIALYPEKGISSSPVDVKETIEYIRSPCLEQLTPAVRLSSVNLLIALFRHAGSCVDEFVHVLPPAVQATYEEEKLKMSHASLASNSALLMSSTSFPSVNSKRLRSESNQGSAPNTSRVLHQSSGPSSSFVPADDLRLVLKQISSEKDWKKRLESVHQIEMILSSMEDEVLPSSVSEQLFKSLHSRFSESNLNFVVDVLRAIPLAIQHSERSVACLCLQRNILPSVFCMLGDQKTSLREEARKISNLGVALVGLDGVLDGFKKPLSLDSNVCRQNVLEVMLAGFDALAPDTPLSKTRLSLLVPGVVNALMDRISEVRALAEQVTACMIRHITGEPFFRHIYQLKTADQNALLPIIERQFQATYNSSSEPSSTVGLSLQPSAQRCSTARSSDGREHSLGSARGTRLSSRLQTGGGRGKGRHSSLDLSTTSRNRRDGSLDSVEEENKTASSVRERQERTTSSSPSSPLPLSPLPGSSHPHFHNSQRAANPNKGDEEKPKGNRPSVGRVSRAPLTLQQVPTYPLADIIQGLRHADVNTSCQMVNDILLYLNMDEECGSEKVVLAAVDRLAQSSSLHQEVELSFALSQCLGRIFSLSENSKRFQNAFLFQILGKLFECLLTESFLRNQPLIKSLNTMVLKLLEECAPDQIFSALLSRLTSYSSTFLQTGGKEDLKYIQITVKCIMRHNFSNASPENIILCCHEYLLQHPPSAFRSVDDLPIRTVKTILQTSTRQHKEHFLELAVGLVGTENLVTNFIRACLETIEKAEENERQAQEESAQLLRVASRSGTPKRSTPLLTTKNSPKPAFSSLQSTPGREKVLSGKGAIPPTKQKDSEKLAATARAPGRVVHADPEKYLPASTSRVQRKTSLTSRDDLSSFSKTEKAGLSFSSSSSEIDHRSKPNMGSIFNKIRNFSTSGEGIDDLYNYFKDNSNSQIKDFDFHFLRCSEPFQLYIKQKIAQKKENDISGTLVILPPSLDER